jgi:hypothetical protein
MVDLTKASQEMLAQIVREAELYLDGQLKLALSADQRASVLSGAYSAGASAIVAGLIALSTSSLSRLTLYPILLGGAGTTVLFLVAAFCCIKSIAPVGFWLPGNEPKSWYSDVISGKQLKEALEEEAVHLQEKIEENSVVLKQNARVFLAGIWTSVCPSLRNKPPIGD